MTAPSKREQVARAKLASRTIVREKQDPCPKGCGSIPQPVKYYPAKGRCQNRGAKVCWKCQVIFTNKGEVAL